MDENHENGNIVTEMKTKMYIVSKLIDVCDSRLICLCWQDKLMIWRMRRQR